MKKKSITERLKNAANIIAKSNWFKKAHVNVDTPRFTPIENSVRYDIDYELNKFKTCDSQSTPTIMAFKSCRDVLNTLKDLGEPDRLAPTANRGFGITYVSGKRDVYIHIKPSGAVLCGLVEDNGMSQVIYFDIKYKFRQQLIDFLKG